MSEPRPCTALAVYDSIAPGEANHWVVSRLGGVWTTGIVRGYEFEISWGPAEGYRGFIPDADGHQVPVSVLCSSELDNRWREIDDFEGAGYERQVVAVALEDDGEIDAHIYVALTEV